MYQISSNLTNILHQKTRILDVKAEIGNKTIGAAGIVDFNIQSSLTDDEGVSIGSAPAAQLDIRFLKSANLPAAWKTEPIKLYIGICNQLGVTNPAAATTFDWIPVGVFYCDNTSVEEESISISIKAFDRMASLDTIVYSTQLSYPNTIANVIKEIGTRYCLGNNSGNSYPNITIQEALSGNVREVIKRLAILLGKNITMDREGKLRISTWNKTKCFSVTESDFEYFKPLGDGLQNLSKLSTTITKTTTTTDEDGNTVENYDDEVITVGSGSGLTYEIESGIVTSQADLQAIYNRAGMPIEYQAYEMSCQGLPHLDVGDTVEVTSGNKTYLVPITSHNLDFTNGLKSTFATAALSQTLSGTSSATVGQITQTVAQIQTDLAKINEIIANKATIANLQAAKGAISDLTAQVIQTEELVADKISTKTFEAEQARVNKLVADKVSTEQLEAAKAEIGQAVIGEIDTKYVHADLIEGETINVDAAWIQQLMVQGNFITPEGEIFYLTSLHINAGDIDAGTLKADRLLLQGDDGLYYQMNINTLGEAQISTLPAAEQELLHKTIHADILTANSITVDKITTNNLQGSGGWINLRNGTFEYQNTTTQNLISWDGRQLRVRGELLLTSGRSIEQGLNDAEKLETDIRSYMQFDNEGLHISKSGSSTESLYSNDGMTIKVGHNPVAEYTSEGTITPSLIIDDNMQDKNQWHIFESAENHLTFSRKL